MNTEQIFSIDMDAQRDKIIARSFKSPYHFPIELVRYARLRNADHIELTLTRRSLTIRDNGAPLTAETMQAIRLIYDSTQDVVARQKALASFERHDSIGLLACFYPKPYKVALHSQHALLLVFGSQVSFQQPTHSSEPGWTSITLHCRQSKSAITQEQQLLTGACAYAPGTICLNGRQINTGDGTPMLLAAHNSNPPRSEAHLRTLSIPVEGDLCQLVHLEQGIVKQHHYFKSKQALVYRAIIEMPPSSTLGQRFTEKMETHARSLYLHLAGSYQQQGQTQQERIEQLLFDAFMATRDEQLLERFTPFAMLDGSTRLSLAEVRALAAQRTIMALERDDRLQDYHLGDEAPLLLSSRQWKFLDALGYSLQRPLLNPTRPPLTARMATAAQQVLQRIRQWWSQATTAAVPHAELTEGERTLQTAVAQHIEDGSFRVPALLEAAHYQIVFSNGRLRPITFVRRENRTTIALARRHPLIRNAVLRITQDGQYIFLIMPALFFGYDGWLID